MARVAERVQAGERDGGGATEKLPVLGPEGPDRAQAGGQPPRTASGGRRGGRGGGKKDSEARAPALASGNGRHAAEPKRAATASAGTRGRSRGNRGARSHDFGVTEAEVHRRDGDWAQARSSGYGRSKPSSASPRARKGGRSRSKSPRSPRREASRSGLRSARLDGFAFPEVSPRHGGSPRLARYGSEGGQAEQKSRTWGGPQRPSTTAHPRRSGRKGHGRKRSPSKKSQKWVSISPYSFTSRPSATMPSVVRRRQPLLAPPSTMVKWQKDADSFEYRGGRYGFLKPEDEDAPEHYGGAPIDVDALKRKKEKAVSDEAEAAARIQSVIRGQQTRKHLTTKVEEVDQQRAAKSSGSPRSPRPGLNVPAVIEEGDEGPETEDADGGEPVDAQAEAARDEAAEAKAATSIQAVARGKRDRARVSEMRKEQAEQAAKEDAAATKIQAVQRGKSARKEQQSRDAAATKIQAHARGKASRAKSQKEAESATRIQAAARGRQGRKKAAAKREQVAKEAAEAEAASAKAKADADARAKQEADEKAKLEAAKAAEEAESKAKKDAEDAKAAPEVSKETNAAEQAPSSPSKSDARTVSAADAFASPLTKQASRKMVQQAAKQRLKAVLLRKRELAEDVDADKLEAARNRLKAVPTEKYAELSHMLHPPPPVVLVGAALCVLVSAKPAWKSVKGLLRSEKLSEALCGLEPARVPAKSLRVAFTLCHENNINEVVLSEEKQNQFPEAVVAIASWVVAMCAFSEDTAEALTEQRDDNTGSSEPAAAAPGKTSKEASAAADNDDAKRTESGNTQSPASVEDSESKQAKSVDEDGEKHKAVAADGNGADTAASKDAATKESSDDTGEDSKPTDGGKTDMEASPSTESEAAAGESDSKLGGSTAGAGAGGGDGAGGATKPVLSGTTMDDSKAATVIQTAYRGKRDRDVMKHLLSFAAEGFKEEVHGTDGHNSESSPLALAQAKFRALRTDDTFEKHEDAVALEFAKAAVTACSSKTLMKAIAAEKKPTKRTAILTGMISVSLGVKNPSWKRARSLLKGGTIPDQVQGRHFLDITLTSKRVVRELFLMHSFWDDVKDDSNKCLVQLVRWCGVICCVPDVVEATRAAMGDWKKEDGADGAKLKLSTGS